MPIADVRPGDLVATRRGWRVRRQRTKRDADVVTVRTESDARCAVHRITRSSLTAHGVMPERYRMALH